jgi:hypothetical protein
MPAVTSRVAAPTAAPDGQDFSLVLGGPLFQFLRKVRLADNALGLLQRRVATAILVMWAPLMGLSALQGGLIGPGRATPFIHDIGFQLRFLVVAPLLIVAELVVHRRLRPIVNEFRVRRLIRAGAAADYDEAVQQAARWRNSVLAEALMIVLIYVVGMLFTLHRYSTLGGGAWFASVSGTRLSLAGLWLVFVSLPLLQLLLLRWYFRLFIWARFLWRIARLDLDLNATHPDKAGGLGFLSDSLAAFAPIAAAHGVLFAGMMVDRIFFAGATLPDFKMEVVGGAVFLTLLFAGPLTVFGPLLARVKRAGLREYGALGQTYVREFRDKWLAGAAPAGEPLIGSGDIQSLADLGNSFASAEQMRIAPIRPTALVYFVAAFLAPILPLALTMMSAERLIDQLIGVVF